MLRLYNGAVSLFRGKFRVETTRLRGWDYAAHAWYFITMVAHNRACYFGDVSNGSVVLSAIGKIVDQFWRAIPAHFPDADIDDFVVMPNHVHGWEPQDCENSFPPYRR